MSTRRRRTSGPMSAAGLVSFYEEFEARIKLSPLAVLFLAIAVATVVGFLHILF